MPKPDHASSLGEYHIGDSIRLLNGKLGRRLSGKVQLILTSPPFPLNNKKSYGNLTGELYRDWFVSLADIFAELLTPDGSIVIELGNSWIPGRPVQSLLHLESLIGFVNAPNADLRLCQQFICYNPARIPSPAQWVTIQRIRATDSYTNVWWIAKSDNPKADNTKVLRPYSKSMKSLLRRRSYNSGRRPSEHIISADGFLTDHGGSIPHNVFEMEPIAGTDDTRLPNAFRIANTNSNDYFTRMCREKGIAPHPARMPPGLASFFIQFLTDPGDIVLDPFSGSNTTGYVAELLNRKWVSIEKLQRYSEQARIRLEDPMLAKAQE
ncbi:MAG: site-specific DNA-methyltransferase [Anaerolineae bacterium]|nr:site-specific DNA-methyltransferase [Anaerolineae bacterium]